MDLDETQLETEAAMEKAVDYLRQELRGVRTGQATPALVEFVKVDYYGSQSDLRQLALITVPDLGSIVIKPYDASSIQQVIKAIQAAGLGLNPASEGKQIRISVPPLSGERRTQLVGQVKQMGEQAKITVRNARRDGNKHVDHALKDKTQHLSEDSAEQAKEEIQGLVKQYEKQVEELISTKTKEVQDM